MINLPPRRQLADPGSTGRQLSSSSFDAASNALGGIGQAVGGIGKKLAAHQVKMNRVKTTGDIAERMLKLAEHKATYQNGLLTKGDIPETWAPGYQAQFDPLVGGFDESMGSLSVEGQAKFKTKLAEFHSRATIEIGASAAVARISMARQAVEYDIELDLKSGDIESAVKKGMAAKSEGLYSKPGEPAVKTETDLRNRGEFYQLDVLVADAPNTPGLKERIKNSDLDQGAKNRFQATRLRSSGVIRADAHQEIYERAAASGEPLGDENVARLSRQAGLSPQQIANIYDIDRSTMATDWNVVNGLLAEAGKYDPDNDPNMEKFTELLGRAMHPDTQLQTQDQAMVVSAIKDARSKDFSGYFPKDILNQAIGALKLKTDPIKVDIPPKETSKQKDTRELVASERSRRQSVVIAEMRKLAQTRGDTHPNDTPEESSKWLEGTWNALVKSPITNDMGRARVGGSGPVSVFTPYPTDGQLKANLMEVADPVDVDATLFRSPRYGNPGFPAPTP